MRRMKAAAHKVFRRLGIDVVRHRPYVAPAARVRETWMRRSGIDLVLDVGANVGQYAMDVRARGYTGRVASFEPLGDVYDKLKTAAVGDAAWQTFNYALGRADEKATIHIAANTESSSLLPMAELHTVTAPYAKITNTRQIEVRRLDSVANAIVRPTDRVWLKVDVQGAEPAVLDGASHTMKQVLFVEQELSLDVLYEGQELIEASIARLRKLGFVPLWFEDVFGYPDGSAALQYSGIFRHVSIPAGAEASNARR